MWMNGSRTSSGTPAKARRTGKPSPSKPDGALCTSATGRSTAPAAGSGRRGSERVSAVTAGMASAPTFAVATTSLVSNPVPRPDVPPYIHRPPGRYPGRMVRKSFGASLSAVLLAAGLLLSPAGASNDRDYAKQWNLEKIGVPDAWTRARSEERRVGKEWRCGGLAG